MNLGRRLDLLERAAPPAAPPVVLTDEELRARFQAILARLVFDDGDGPRYPATPPAVVVALARWFREAQEHAAARPPRPGARTLGATMTAETADLLLAILDHWARAVTLGVWPDLDTAHGRAG